MYASGSYSNGALITFSSNISIPAGTSSTFEVRYGTTDMNNKTWSSIITVDASTGEQHEILMQSVTP